MERVLRRGGRMILIETLGTGETIPDPEARFREMYDFLEGERKFQPEWIRTDYRFETMEQIREVVVPLFGEGMISRLVPTPEGFVLPECTGLWWREV
jgi:hypothetical protein